MYMSYSLQPAPICDEVDCHCETCQALKLR